MTANANTDNRIVNDNSLDGARAWFAEEGLSRPTEGRVIGRVNRFVARAITIAAAIGFTPLAYVALWVLMPSE